MIKARPKYPTDLDDNIYIDDIKNTVVICLTIPTRVTLQYHSHIYK